MINEPVQPYTGPTNLDLQAIVKILVDLAPGAMQHLGFEKPGCEGVIEELSKSVPALGDKAGVSPNTYAHFVECNENIAQIRATRAVIDKLAEVLEESEAYYVHQRECDIGVIADTVRSTARRKDESIRAAFEKTLKYNSQIAEKAVKTRRKNAAAAAAEQSDGATHPPAEDSPS